MIAAATAAYTHYVAAATQTAPPTPQVEYVRRLTQIACESPALAHLPTETATPPLHTDAITPTIALAAAIIALGNGTSPITRNGLDAALDQLFAHPDIAPLLLTLDPDTFADQVLPRTHPRFADFWTHIVRPAWDQHVDIARACAASGSVAAPENAPAALPS